MGYINPGARRSLASLASATSNNGTARNGTAVSLNGVHPGTLSALCVGSTKTSSVVATYKWQVSMDGSTYHDLKPMNNAASVTTASGTGSDVAYSLVLDCPISASGWAYARPVATLSGAATAAEDVTAVTCRWLQCDEIFS